MTHDLLIHGGRLILRDGDQEADLLIRAGKVAALGEDLKVSPDCPRLDASGHWVFPGLIDPQVHFREPGLEHKEDLASGSLACVAGGVTAFCEMPNTTPPTTDPAALQDKFERAAGRASADHAFFLGGTAENAEALGEWENLPGCAGIKVFMGSSTGNLLIEDDPTLERLLRSGKRRVTVHSEDNPRLSERYAEISEGTSVVEHPSVRDVECALKATRRLLNLVEATGRPVHLLHVSTAEEMQMVLERDLGDLVTVEATPNHLFLAAPECYEVHGTWAQMNPPVRDVHHQDALRRALVEGPVTCIGSDHAPHTPEEKAKPYPHSPSGIAGTQTILPLLLTAVRDGWLSPQDIVRLSVDGPRRVYGIENKGALDVGCDGDVTLVDPSVTEELPSDWLRSRAGRSPFEGTPLAGWPVTTVLRGQIVYHQHELVGVPIGQPLTFTS
ncbi:MAG: dihydroorotase [Planctomycetota bacterium]|jgi:dihydroorotase|nr:dihydroorotase [Planctomycetota bacterium]MDP6939383.1 dihydroorotase [Planctomycetota bacterium]